MAAWSNLFSVAHRYFGNPFIYLPVTLIGCLILAATWGEGFAHWKISRAGGITKKEFPAHLRQWRDVQNFPTWQLAWLWNDLEPQKGDTEGTTAYATFRLLKEHLDKGYIKGAARIDGSWLETPLSRQQLIDYALKIGARPKFLFFRRHSWIGNFYFKLAHQVVQPSEVNGYMELSNFTLSLYGYLKEHGQENNFTAEKEKFFRNEFLNGNWIAIGRLKIDGYLYEHEIIPQWKWEFFESAWAGANLGGDEFSDVRIKQKKKKGDRV